MTSCDKDEGASLIPQFQSLKHGLQKRRNKNHEQYPTSLKNWLFVQKLDLKYYQNQPNDMQMLTSKRDDVYLDETIKIDDVNLDETSTLDDVNLDEASTLDDVSLDETSMQ
ncbi:unnamed protein product [Brachionus calyciflorus]|uniref:Uncharacterized protein n=1 Tax=Brachionus calyciflorus TaxID=104777 RepID=A0A813TW18_9BILA|nr:unnamed protein product [Brachionus calyciflorus]